MIVSIFDARSCTRCQGQARLTADPPELIRRPGLHFQPDLSIPDINLKLCTGLPTTNTRSELPNRTHNHESPHTDDGVGRLSHHRPPGHDPSDAEPQLTALPGQGYQHPPPLRHEHPHCPEDPRRRKGASRILCQSRFASSTAQAAVGAEAPAQLDWNTFFQLRKTRRRIQVLFSIAGAATCGTAGSWMLATGIAEPLLSLIPLDPFITMGLMAFSSATLGWLLGPSLGAGVFNMWHRRIKPQMASKEKEFFARIKKHRVDPSTSSVGNPVPDFYGEKISSVSGYRQWLKDQRAYNRKRTRFV
ncbi:unnamed protein product [Parascedosporium putredinis]|uniref:Presequence translocated-associated motor subunit PAM17 n=1 Tax=Parascedosporium putredinis TaxID=1442378 RepID=A0A9P1MBZ9_9PEZI|nr:unnamed protein product [Parascedosporium putredinis]CAI7997442.1 unnamed protein product [Parascedosporium putredinis]